MPLYASLCRRKQKLQVDQRKWKALVEREGRNALLAAKKDCAILSLLPPDDPGTAVRRGTHDAAALVPRDT